MSDRSRWGSVGAHESWARTEDRSARTAPARQAALERFERQVDPDGTLPPAERRARAVHARKAHMARLAMASAAARRIKAESRTPKSLSTCACGRPTTGRKCSECRERGAA